MFSFSKKDEGGVIAIFDIRSASVGGALVLLRKNKKPRVLYSVRKPIAFVEKLEVDKFTSSMLRALNLVVDDIQKKGVVHLNFRVLQNKEVKEAFCFFSSPWYASQMETVKINEKEPILLTREIIQSLVQKEKEDFENAGSGVFGGGSGVEIIDNKIIQFRLNGYKTENPFKKKVKQVEASVFMSLLSADIADKVEKTVLKAFHLDKIHMHSSALTNFLVLRDMFEAEDDSIIIDVSGEVTDISYTKNDVLKEVQSFPMGKNSLIRGIVDSFKIDTEVVYATEIPGYSKTYNASVDLANLTKAVDADAYLSGSGGKDYLDLTPFKEGGIEVRFQEYHHPGYPQRFPGFAPYMGAIDALFNVGPGIFENGELEKAGYEERVVETV